MGGGISKVPLLGDAVGAVSHFVKPVVDTVGGFAKPLWKVGKSVAKFVPGASEMMEGVEGIGSELLSGLGEDAKEAQQQIEDIGEAIGDTTLRNYRDTRRELEEGYEGLRDRGRRSFGRAKQSLGKLKDLGGGFMKTIKNPAKWQEQYGLDEEEDEEDNNLRMARKKARESRRRRRQRVRVEEED